MSEMPGRRPANSVIPRLAVLIESTNRVPSDGNLIDMINETPGVSGPGMDWVYSRRPVNPKVLYSQATSENLMKVINHHRVEAGLEQAQVSNEVSIFNRRFLNMKSYEDAVNSAGKLSGVTFVEQFSQTMGISEVAAENIMAGRLISNGFAQHFLAQAPGAFGVDPSNYVRVDEPLPNQAIAPLKADKGLASVIDCLRNNNLV